MPPRQMKRSTVTDLGLLLGLWGVRGLWMMVNAGVFS